MENYFQMDFTPKAVNGLSNLALAHLGDGVFSLLCRAYLCKKGDKSVKRLHLDSIALVKAPTQAAFAEKILPGLTEAEADYYRRGKNAHVHAVPKGATPAQYAKATGLEALFGRLYLEGKTERINTLFCLGLEGGESHGL